MAFLERDRVAAPSMRRQTVHLASQGGDVIVRSRMLPERMALNALQERIKALLPGETEDERNVRVGSAVVALTLALQVVLPDDMPLFTAEQWALHGAEHPDEVLHLYEVANGLSGSDREALEKNSQPSLSVASPSPSRSGWVARLRNWAGG